MLRSTENRGFVGQVDHGPFAVLVPGGQVQQLVAAGPSAREERAEGADVGAPLFVGLVFGGERGVADAPARRQHRLVWNQQPPLGQGLEDLAEHAHLNRAGRVQRFLPRGKQPPIGVVPISMVGAGQIGVVGLPADPHGRHVEAIFPACLIGPFGHENRFGRFEPVVEVHHRVDQLDGVPRLDRVEVQPLLVVQEAGGVGRRVGLETHDVAPPVAFAQSFGQLANDRHKRLRMLGRGGPNDVGNVLVALAQPLAPRPRLVDGEILAVALVVDGRQDEEVVFAGDLEHGVHVLEIRLVGRPRIVVEQGFLAVSAGRGAVAAAEELDLDEGKAVLLGFLDDGPGVLQRVPVEELPLRGADPEHGLVVLVDEVSPVLAHLDGEGRLLGRSDGPEAEQQRQEQHDFLRSSFHIPSPFVTNSPGLLVSECERHTMRQALNAGHPIMPKSPRQPPPRTAAQQSISEAGLRRGLHAQIDPATVHPEEHQPFHQQHGGAVQKRFVGFAGHSEDARAR